MHTERQTLLKGAFELVETERTRGPRRSVLLMDSYDVIPSAGRKIKSNEPGKEVFKASTH